MEIYFDNLKEETQKELLDNAGISSPEEANWDVFPVAVVETENMLHDKAVEIMCDYLDGDGYEAMVEQLRSLMTKGVVSKALYDYIIDNWDELLSIKEDL